MLLADEVGLGKTIESCLILHRLLLTGRTQRVLILVPESLVHQWFVELLRRFNLWFSIFDEDYHISRFFNFSDTGGQKYSINGETATHVTIDPEITSIL